MSKKITKKIEIELAREFFGAFLNAAENQDDGIYELIDPECKYGSELYMRLNNYTIKEVVALGFKAKYGSELLLMKDE